MIYYSHVNEDNLVERNVLMSHPAKSLYAIAGSGERVLALMDCPQLESVHLIDNNQDALYLCELKIIALRQLSVDDYFSFVGHISSKDCRYAQFETLKPLLSKDCVQFWEKNYIDVEIGICHCGHFEKFLRRFNPMIRLFLGKRFYQCFLVAKKDWKKFPFFRWRIVMTLFSMRWTYLLLGMNDAAFVSKDAELSIIPTAIQQSLDEEGGVAKSAMMHLIFNNHLHEMPEAYLPPSIRKDVLMRIKTALQDHKIQVYYHFGDVLDVMKHLEMEKKEPSFFSLSDILSFVDNTYQQNLIAYIANVKRGKATLVFRTFVRNRLSKDQVDELKRKYATCEDLSCEERSHFYQAFQITC